MGVAAPSCNMASLLPLFFSHDYLLLFLLLLFAIVLPSRCAPATQKEFLSSHHTVDVRSLLPSDACSPSKGSDEQRLNLVHQHGPCSPLHRKKNLSHKKILNNDQSRVDWLHHRISSSTSKQQDKLLDSLDSATIPARSGNSLSTGNYIVSIGIGTPKRDFSVVFDTGSDVTWIQCKPCVSYCYPQQEPLFDPLQSSTYANISCGSPYCSQLNSYGCSGSGCLYSVQYGDKSYTVGFFAQDTLTLTPSNVIQNFRFGCGEKNKGIFGRAAGLLGLGRAMTSLVSQAYQMYGGVFSYCIPPTASSMGYLSFGSSSAMTNVKYTPMLAKPNTPSFYYLNLVAISVGGQQLSIPPSVFSTAGTIIDSGTVITRLPPAAYSALRTAFKQNMAGYKSAPGDSLLDTCYDFTGYNNITIPTVELHFDGSVTANMDASGILYVYSISQACLAFAGNSDPDSIAIFGNTQQRTFNVVYDVSKKVIGFSPGGC
ncbi:aspartyl protease family protein At5g10770-like isoform X2 [Typha angustifolia]|uniref:aspartyl protease family protein At5g10770-like isoform X2 n=1 Tax=Typha angustifolia TaxID=59011 RepID=UPI003C2DD80A